MREDIFEQKMKFATRMGINIASHHLVWREGFIGTYKHVMGVNFKEEFADDPVLLEIATKLMAMQSSSRMLIGSFFHASINYMHKTLYIELFFSELGMGTERKGELLSQLRTLLEQFLSWLHKD